MSEHDNTIAFRQSNSCDQQSDPLTELAREGARKLLADALEAEVQALLDQHRDEGHNGRQAVTRNGYLPEREVETGVGSVPVQVPKVRDKSGQGIKFNSSLVPPYLKRSHNLEDFIPLLYLKGVSSGDMSEALSALTGQQASLSPNTLSRLKQQWQDEHQAWCQRRFDHARYVYLWADGVYFNVRGDDHYRQAHQKSDFQLHTVVLDKEQLLNKVSRVEQHRIYVRLCTRVLNQIAFPENPGFVHLWADRCKRGLEARDLNTLIRSNLETRLPLTTKITLEQTPSSEHYGLQAVDMFSYGFYRKHEHHDLEWYSVFSTNVFSEVMI
jgi:hypothetical protein